MTKTNAANKVDTLEDIEAAKSRAQAELRRLEGMAQAKFMNERLARQAEKAQAAREAAAARQQRLEDLIASLSTPAEIEQRAKRDELFAKVRSGLDHLNTVHRHSVTVAVHARRLALGAWLEEIDAAKAKEAERWGHLLDTLDDAAKVRT